ncbi:unnamed protein product [Closterium sp. NIES-65]|nr:unnamed protein product [Closterium sp. NIES-65]
MAVSLANPSRGPVLAQSSTVLLRLAVPSGLHLPSFSTNLVSGADLQDVWVDQFTPGGQRVTHCTCTRTGRHLATFTRQPGSNLYTVTTVSPPVTASGQVAASGQTLLWHHRLAHPSLPRLRGMASRVLVTGLPRSLPPLSPGPAPTCIPCIEGRQRAAPHSSEFPLTEAPLQTLHMDVWGPARVRGQGHERYFLLVADNYSHYTTVFPLHRKDKYAAHQLNLQPRVYMPETTPTLRWTGKVGDASAFCVWGSRAFVRDLFADKLSSRAVPCVFLGFPPYAPGWQFYHPTSRRVLSSHDVTFDESVPYYRLFLYRTAPLPPLPLFLAPDAVEPVEVAIESGAARGAEPAGVGSGGAEPGGAGSWGAEPGGAEPERAEPGIAELGGTASGGAEPRVAESEGAKPVGTEPARVEPGSAEPGGPLGALSRREPLSPHQLREWFTRRWSRAAGASGATGDGGLATTGDAGGSGATGPGGALTGGTVAAGPGGGARAGAAGGAGAGDTAGAGAVGGAAAGATGATGTSGGPAGAGSARGAGVGAAGAAGGAAEAGGGAKLGADAGGAGAVSAGSSSAARPPPYFVPLLQQVLGLPPSTSLTPLLECPPPVQSQSQLQPASPLPTPSPYTGPIGGLAERREPASCPASLVPAARTRCRGSRQCPPPVPGTHQMAHRPSTAPQRVPLPSPPVSSLPVGLDPESDSLRAASPTITRLLATVLTDPSFESTAASALVAGLVDFAARCRLDYAASLVAESESVCPPSVGGECALSRDILEDRQEEFQSFAAALPHLVSMLLTPEGDPDAPDIPTPRSYVEAIEGPYSSQW